MAGVVVSTRATNSSPVPREALYVRNIGASVFRISHLVCVRLCTPYVCVCCTSVYGYVFTRATRASLPSSLPSGSTCAYHEAEEEVVFKHPQGQEVSTLLQGEKEQRYGHIPPLLPPSVPRPWTWCRAISQPALACRRYLRPPCHLGN